jgi:hypothetical protein
LGHLNSIVGGASIDDDHLVSEGKRFEESR